MVNACWWYYFSKFTEFFDTVSIHHFVKTEALITIYSSSFSLCFAKKRVKFHGCI